MLLYNPIMKYGRTFLFIIVIIFLLIFGLIIGERIGNLSRVSRGDAMASSSISTPVDFFSQEFASSTDIVPVSGIAVGGLGDALLKSNVWNSLLDYERKQNCLSVISKAVSVEQINEAGEYWVEDWSVDACGKTKMFKIKFTPDQVGGTIYYFVP